MNNRVFVTSDTHFGHSKIIEFEVCRSMFSTIQEHDEALITYWNETVKPLDTVWHLGDVLFGHQNFGILDKLHGRKHLVMGNHDHYPQINYADHFHKILGSVAMHGYIFTHIPVHPDQFKRFKGNVHGHSHSKSYDDPRYINACVELHGLKPVLLDKLLADAEKRMVPKCRICGVATELNEDRRCKSIDCVPY